MGYKVVVAGATGNVGREMVNILADRQFPIDDIALLASSRSVGEEIELGDSGRRARVHNATVRGAPLTQFGRRHVGRQNIGIAVALGPTARRWAPISPTSISGCPAVKGSPPLSAASTASDAARGWTASRSACRAGRPGFYGDR